MDKRCLAVLFAGGLVGCSATDMGNDPGSGPEAALVCTNPTAQAPVLGETFNVRFGQQATIVSEGLTLKFDQILGDSRCPMDVLCIWMGEAKIVVRAAHPPDATANVELTTPGPSPDNSETYAGYEIELVRITPQTQSTQAIDPDDYCAELRVERVP
jgi:hypothetical protein